MKVHFARSAVLFFAVGIALAQQGPTWLPTPAYGQPYRPGQPLSTVSNGQCLGNNGGQWGSLACSGGGAGVPVFSQAQTAQTSVTISAATHGQGTKPFAWCVDSGGIEQCKWVPDGSGNLVFTFSPAFTGTIYVGGGQGGGGGGSGTVNIGLINQLGYYAAGGTAISGLATANNSVFTTDGSGVPAPRTTLPSGLTIPGALSISVGSSAPALTCGTGGCLAFNEGNNPIVGPASGVDVFSFSDTQHGLLANFNNAGYLPLVQGPASAVSGHLATWSGTNGGKLVDGGVLPTIPSVTTVLKGDGAGNAVTSKVSFTAPTTAATVAFVQDNQTTTLPNGTLLSSTASAAVLSCQVLDNAICTSAVDASGNPAFLATAAGVALPINGGTTPLVMFINGVYQNLNTNVTLTVPSTASVQQWILAVQDTTNANMVAGDFLAMNTAPFYQYTAPTCPSPGTALSATNPSFWFDLSTNLSKTCTSNGGAYSANPSMVIGTIFVDATPKVLNILTEPYRLNPYKRFELFGTGADGVITVSGTTTIDVHKQYQSVIVLTGGTLTHTALVGANTLLTGLSLFSQSPIMVIGSGTVTATGLGHSSQAGQTGAGQGGNNSGGRGGGGGGGGGSGATSTAGGAGGNRSALWATTVSTGGGSAGAATPTAGGNATAINQPDPPQTNYSYQCSGTNGGSGAGDATNAGGASGAGGGTIFMKMPSLFVLSTASITANGNNGSAGVAGNAAGGGGGGGGCLFLNAGFLSVSGATITVTGGTGGAKAGAGSGTAGGNGSAGVLQQNKLW